MIGCHLLERGDHVVNIRSISRTNSDSNTVFLRWSASFIDDFAIADHAIWDGYLDVITGQNSCAAQSNVRNYATLASLENNEVTRLVWRVHNNRHAGEQVRQCVPGRETERETYDAGRCDPRCDIDVPREEYKVNSEREQDDFDDVLNQRKHAGLDELVATIAACCLHEDIGQLVQHCVPNGNRYRLENAQGDKYRCVWHSEALRCKAQSQQYE